MSITLLELKKLAIERRAKILFRDNQSEQSCEIQENGVVRVLLAGAPLRFADDPVRVDADRLAGAAEEFVLQTGDVQKRLTRAELTALIKGRGAAAGAEHEDADA